MTTERTPEDLTSQFAELSPREQRAVMGLLDLVRVMTTLEVHRTRLAIAGIRTNPKAEARTRGFLNGADELLEAAGRPSYDRAAVTNAALALLTAAEASGTRGEVIDLAAESLKSVPADLLLAEQLSLFTNLLDEWADAFKTDRSGLLDSWVRKLRDSRA